MSRASPASAAARSPWALARFTCAVPSDTRERRVSDRVAEPTWSFAIDWRSCSSARRTLVSRTRTSCAAASASNNCCVVARRCWYRASTSPAAAAALVARAARDCAPRRKPVNRSTLALSTVATLPLDRPLTTWFVIGSTRAGAPEYDSLPLAPRLSEGRYAPQALRTSASAFRRLACACTTPGCTRSASRIASSRVTTRSWAVAGTPAARARTASATAGLPAVISRGRRGRGRRSRRPARTGAHPLEPLPQLLELPPLRRVELGRDLGREPLLHRLEPGPAVAPDRVERGARPLERGPHAVPLRRAQVELAAQVPHRHLGVRVPELDEGAAAPGRVSRDPGDRAHQEGRGEEPGRGPAGPDHSASSRPARTISGPGGLWEPTNPLGTPAGAMASMAGTGSMPPR